MSISTHEVVNFYSAFNNIWSNIGYVILGGAFIIIVAIRFDMQASFDNVYMYMINFYAGIAFTLNVIKMVMMLDSVGYVINNIMCYVINILC